MTSRQIEDQERFHIRVLQEWRRAERSSRPALLILFDGLENIAAQREAFIGRAGSLFRDTDVLGWYVTGKTLGVICLELGKSVLPEARQAIISKIDRHLLSACTPCGAKVKMIVHALPPYAGDPTLTEPDAEFAESFSRLMTQNQPWAASAIKRAFDIAGSGVLLLLLLPMLLAIAAAIRLTSRGPALYRQVRTGLGGRAFSLYKFRTMRADADDRQHLEYVRQFIHGKAEKHLDDRGQPVYKLTRDPRVTPIGRFLRRSSLDELPQLWNVLYGDMTLVGPRPPLPFEVGCYDLWHRRRVFELKPGLTGLWQVRGRSRCSFDEMIRLDLQHGKPNSLALYLRVLLETPRAVISGGGAQ
jgi:lipopolysaccharide/colanic/teichoic acid biosynthesis glycosyltransferase